MFKFTIPNKPKQIYYKYHKLNHIFNFKTLPFLQTSELQTNSQVYRSLQYQLIQMKPKFR